MAETEVAELSTFWVNVTFKNKNGLPEMPTGITWGVYDGIDGTKLSTGISTPSTGIEIQVTSTANAIRHGKPYERRTVNVLATYTSGQLLGEHSWQVENLGFST